MTFFRRTEMPADNGRFGASGAVARLKVCANLEVYRPSERQWKPRLRQAAGTLGASGRQRGGQRTRTQKVRSEKPDKEIEINRFINEINFQKC